MLNITQFFSVLSICGRVSNVVDNLEVSGNFKFVISKPGKVMKVNITITLKGEHRNMRSMPFSWHAAMLYLDDDDDDDA